jgi:hypothetical protein
MPVVDPKTPKDLTPAPAPAPTPDSLSGEGRYKSVFGLGTAVSGGFGIGASVASAGAGLPATGIPPFGNNAASATFNSTFTPLILPGLFSAAASQSVMPLDRVSFDYGYFSRFAIASPTGAIPGFNLNQFNVGIEKTFFDGLASVYIAAPFLSTSENVSGQTIDGIGDVSAGFKVLLYQNRDTGTTFAGGLTVAFPSGHASTVTSTTNLNLTFTGPSQPGLPAGTLLGPFAPVTTTTSVNPTYFQPWTGGLLVCDKVFVQEYFGVIVPSDTRVATFINNNVTFGYTLYSNQSRTLSSVTPTFSVQALLPVNHISNSASSSVSTVSVNIPCTITAIPADQIPPPTLSFPDQVFLTAGAQIGIGERCLFNIGVSTPVVGPRGYAVGGVFGLTYLY